jgi:hypothetical protein
VRFFRAPLNRDGSIEVETGSSQGGYYPEDYDSIVYDEYREIYMKMMHHIAI